MVRQIGWCSVLDLPTSASCQLLLLFDFSHVQDGCTLLSLIVPITLVCDYIVLSTAQLASGVNAG